MERLKRIWKFISSKFFVYNIVGAIAFYVAVFFLFSIIVRSYTKHGQSIPMPDLQGSTIEQAEKMLLEKHLKFEIIDSIYYAEKVPLSIIDQNPKPNQEVKEWRVVYLTINSEKPPLIKMPDLKDASLKQATMVLESYGMRVGALIYKPGMAENVVIEQLFKGRPINPGEMIEKGSRIDLVLENGIGETEVAVPDLIGLTIMEARFVLEGSSLQLGAVVVHSSVAGDTTSAVIYQQIPNANDVENNMVNVGEAIDVFITSPDQLKTEPEPE